MTEEEKIEFRKKLEIIISETEKNIELLKERSKPISPENSLGRITRMDAINNKSVAEAALRTAQRKLAKLKMSLSQLENEGFGKCSICDAPIQARRLMFMPESSYCVRCAGRR